jgi:hypothetical protein
MEFSGDSEESSAEGRSSIDDTTERLRKNCAPKVCLDVHDMQ